MWVDSKIATALKVPIPPPLKATMATGVSSGSSRELLSPCHSNLSLTQSSSTHKNQIKLQHKAEGQVCVDWNGHCNSVWCMQGHSSKPQLKHWGHKSQWQHFLQTIHSLSSQSLLSWSHSISCPKQSKVVCLVQTSVIRTTVAETRQKHWDD